MAHRSKHNRIAALFAGASLAALSVAGMGRASAAGATGTTVANQTGAFTVAQDFNFINFFNDDLTIVTNDFDIGDGFNNPAFAGDSSVAVFVREDTVIQTFFNQASGNIHATEGTNTSNNATTAQATATAIRIDGTVLQLTNDGTILARAVAHDTTTTAEATAFARAIEYDGQTGPDRVAGVDNSGSVSAFATANALGVNDADADASAVGIDQFVTDAIASGGNHDSAQAVVENDGTMFVQGQAFASATSGDARAFADAVVLEQEVEEANLSTALVDNDGGLTAVASATAHAFSFAFAEADATGVDQDANGLTATASVENSGHIDATAKAFASGTFVTSASQALADAEAVGVSQEVGADATGTASVSNDGLIQAFADARAFASQDATASATATGVFQDPAASVAGGTATATVNNDGKIEAYAQASAFAFSSASAVAIAFGVVQNHSDPNDVGAAAASVNNDGEIEAKAYARAGSSSDASVASAIALASGVFQDPDANNGGGTATATVDNDGTIEAFAQASAFAFSSASAVANAFGVFQGPDANDGGGTATATVNNDGDIEAKAYATAGSSSIAASVAGAQATASGVGQAPNANDGDGTATATVNNDGKIEAYAQASAFAFTSAAANALAFGVFQDPDANDEGGTATAKVNNSGNIEAKAYARADSFSSIATAFALASGVFQDPDADGEAGTIAATVNNSGKIEGEASASAFASSSAFATASAFGVRQSLSDEAPTATVENSGSFVASAYATAGAPHAEALATAVGIDVEAETLGNTLDVNIVNSGVIEAKAAAKANGSTAAVASAFATGIFVGTDFELTGSIVNSGSIFATAIASGTTGTAQAIGINDPSDVNNAHIVNTGLIFAYAQVSNSNLSAFATGIAVNANVTGEPGLAVITNDGGTIWAGKSFNGGATIERGNAINTVNEPNPVLIELKGEQGDGHIYGDILISPDDAIEVTDGKTFLDGDIDDNFAGGSLDIFNGGKLVLCQEGWSGACDPNGWGNANYDPQQGVNLPSFVNITDFTVQTDGTIAYQLTPNNGPLQYPQVFANTANLAGTLEAQFLPGFYANKTLYDNIVQANVIRNGTFDSVEDNSLFLKATAIYDGNNVDLSVKRTPFNNIGGLTKNEKSAAGGIEHVFKKLPGPGVDPSTTNAFGQLVANLFTIDNKKDYAALLDQLSGAQFAQELQSVLWSLRPLNESITDRMDCSLNHSNIGPVARGYDDKALGAYEPYGCFVPGQWQAWARVWGGWNNNDGDANAPGYDERQWAIWGGADYALGDTVVLGVAGGFFRSDNMDFEKFGGVSGGSIEYDGGQIAGYGGWDNGVWYDRAIVSGGFYDGESRRNFAFRAPAVDPSGSPDADVVSFYNEAGRRFGVWTNVSVTPFAGITVAHAELDSFTENDKNNTGIALKVSGDDADSVASILGLRFNGSWGAFKPQVALGWEHEFDDTFQTVNVSFASAPSGSNFRVIGTDLGEDALVVDAGASYAVGAASDISVRYVGRFLEDYDAQSVMGRWTYKWGAAPVAAPPPPVYKPLKLGE